MVLALLPNTRAVQGLMLPLCALSKREQPIDGWDGYLDPKVIPAHDRDMYFVKLKYCSESNLLPSLQTASDQHA
eukprot:scaffold66619_cov17-Tisochrysis_lutea.AAC.1